MLITIDIQDTNSQKQQKIETHQIEQMSLAGGSSYDEYNDMPMDIDMEEDSEHGSNNMSSGECYYFKKIYFVLKQYYRNF